MRKESMGRLLLTLVTAFIMVAGVFGAALQTWSFTSQNGDMSNQIADGELDMETRETGDEPVSASDSDLNTIDGQKTGQWTSRNGDAAQLENCIVTDTIADQNPNADTTDWESPASTDMILDHGTRAPTVDAGGPYGEMPPGGIPYIEGDTVTFDATMSGGNVADYYFRWEVNGDKNWDVNHFPPAQGGDNTKGVTSYIHEYRDNFIGEGIVEAWDGVSLRPGPEGNMQDEQYYDGSYWLPVPRFYQNPPPNGRDGTWGLQFDVYKDCIVDQLGFFKTYAPNPVYNVKLWEMSTQTCIGVNLALTPLPYYDWKWVSIKDPADPYGPDISLNLQAGESYIVSAYMYYSDGRYPKNDNPGPTNDGVMEPITSWFNTGGDSYPGIYERGGDVVLLDVHYISFEPDVIEDTAGIFVDNSVPIASNPQAIGAPGLEGSELGFTAYLWDAGLDDDWWYRWDFGDGSVSDWIAINKWAGGGTILFCTSWTGDDTAIGSALDSALGNFDQQIDYYNFYTSGAPDLELLMEYDVVITGENTIVTPTVREEMGDVLADYSDQGGNVVTMWVTDMYDTLYGYGEGGITGRWRDEYYNIFTPNDLRFAYVGMGTVYDPSHPVLQGVGTLSVYYGMQNHDYEVGTTPLADNTNGEPFVGYKYNPIGSGGRIVGVDMFPIASMCSGDYMKLMANAVKWASQQPDPGQIPMPIPLEPCYHTYRDDHPTSVTPEDIFDVSVEIKDDDHEKMVGGAQGIVINELNTNVDRIELYNYGADIDLTGWMLYNDEYPSQGLHTYTFPQFTLKQYKFVLLHENGNPANDDDDDLYMPGNVYWNNNGPSSCVSLVDTSGTCVDYVPWNGYENNPNPAVPIHPWNGHLQQPGDAIYRVTDTDTDDAADWNVGPDGDTTDKALNPGQTGVGPPIGEVYILEGLSDPAYTTALIKNVFPEAINKLGVVLDVDENTPMTFEGFEITDPAKASGTEEFWYRWDFDDSTPIGPWIYNKPGVTKFRVLLYHGLASTGQGSTMAQQVIDTLNSLPIVDSVTAFNFYDGGAYPATPTLQEMIDNYDIIMFGCCYNLGGSPGDQRRTEFGDRLADWMDLTGGGFVSMMYAYGQAGSANEQWTLLGRYMDDDYGPYEKATRLSGTLSLGNILQPGHPVMQGISTLGCGDRHDGMLAMTPGGVKLAEWTDGTPAIGVKELPNGARSVHLSGGGYTNIQGDYDIFLGNALLWAGENIMGEPIQTVDHNFMDNGVYNVHLEIIDDDMMWDFSSGYPVFTGTPGTEQQWIGGTIFPVSVDNTDPVISPGIRAYAELDLSIRTTGQPMEDVEMRLYKGSTLLGSVICHHDQNEKIKVLSGVTIEMTEINDYRVEVEYFGTGGGANPTWIFSGHFPSGKIKELKHEFKDGDPVWIIGPDMLKKMIIGEDIIFEATVSDHGSDDLAFIWNYGDSTPFGVHIYANADPDVFVGVTDEATVIFDQDPDREPWFDKGPNTIRSPWGSDMTITDKITHVFDENQPHYYYVTLTVFDDDVKDDYPSIQAPYYTGCDIVDIEIDLR